MPAGVVGPGAARRQAKTVLPERSSAAIYYMEGEPENDRTEPMVSSTDKMLLDRWVARRDAEAFKEIVARHSAMVYATCKRILGDATAAEDITQECFLAASQAEASVGAYLPAWLHKVATYRSVSRVRAESRRKRREQEYVDESTSRAQPHWNEIEDLVDEAIEQLPDKLKAPVICHFLENQTHETIAQALGIPRRTVSYRIGKGIEHIRKHLRRRGVAVGGAALAGLLAANSAEAVPPALVATLGKVALAGARESALATTAVTAKTATLLGGVLAVKAKTGTIAAAIVLLTVVGILLFQHGEEAGGQSHETQPRPTALSDSAPTAPAPEPTPSPAVAASHSGKESHPATDFSSRSEPVEVAPDLPSDDTGKGVERGVSFASISGYVVDSEGYAIPAAPVVVRTQGKTRTTETDDDGLYAIEDIEFTGEAIVAVNAHGYYSAAKTVSLEAGDQLENVDFILSKGVSLVARLLDRQGVPVPFAEVKPRAARPGSLFSHTDRNVAFTDLDGVFQLGFHGEGAADLWVSSSAGRAIFTGVSVGTGDLVELRMPQGVVLRGIITWDDGTPGADLVVGLHALTGGFSSGSAFHTSTDSAGRYELSTISPGEIMYSATVSTREGKTLCPKQALGAFSERETRTWDYVLSRSMTVTGSVIGEDSRRPLSHIIIVYTKDGGELKDVRVQDGTYMLRLFEPGTYLIAPAFDGWRREELMDEYGREVRWERGGQAVVDFEVPDLGTLSVRVLDTGGNPVAGANVWQFQSLPQSVPGDWSLFNSNAHTDASGEFSWDGCAPGTKYWLYVQKEGFIPTETAHMTHDFAMVPPIETVVLFASAGIEGRLVDVHGNPIADGAVSVIMKPDEGVIRPLYLSDNIDGAYVTATTDADGVFAVAEGLPATTGTLAVSAHNESEGVRYVSEPLRIECLAGQIVNLGDLVLEPVANENAG